MSRRSSELDSIEHDLEDTRHRIDDTLDSLAEKVSSSRLVGEALNRVRANGGEFAGNLAQAVRENPIATTMVATGFAWLALSGRNGRYDDGPDHHQPDHHQDDDPAVSRWRDEGAADRQPPTVAGQPVPDEHAPAAIGYPVAPTSGTSEPTIGDRARNAGERVAAAASSGTRSIADRARRAGDAVQGAGADVQARAADAASRTRGAAHDARGRAERARAAAGRRTADIYARARDATRRAGSFLAENPLMVGALGLALGGIAAAMLPSTRREDEWVGETGDRVRDEAAASARWAASEGGEVARAAAASAKAEAQRQRLTPEEARKAGNETAARVVRGGAEVARTAVETAEEEAQRRSGKPTGKDHRE